MPNKAKSHEDCRSSVCLLYMRKGDRYLNDFIIARIRKLVKSNIMQMNEFHELFATHVEQFYKKM